MGTYAGKIHTRGYVTNPSATNYTQIGNLETLVFCCNSIMDAFEQSGMLKVSDADFLGQAKGKYVGAATSNSPNETVITISTTNGLYDYGYKVFKHPVLPVWIKVNLYLPVRQSGYNHFCVTYTIGNEINTSGFVGETQEIDSLIKIYNTAYSGIGQPCIDSSAMNLFASCGPDYFWVASDGSVKYSGISNSTNKANSAFYPNSVCPFGLAIFAQPGRDEYIIISPAKTGYNYSYNEICSEYFINIAGANRKAATKIYAYDGVLFKDKNGYYPSYPEPTEPSLSNGIRIYQGNAVVRGNRSWFDYGLLPQSQITQGGVYELDLWGTGVKQYIGINSFGTYGDCGTALQMNTSNSIGLLLPWNAGG